MNRQIEDRWHIGLELPVVFIDSWSQKKGHEDNPSEQEHFISETKKLWDFAMSHDEFKFKGIDEILQENEAMRNEIDWLNEIITKNITELQGNMTELAGSNVLNPSWLISGIRSSSAFLVFIVLFFV